MFEEIYLILLGFVENIFILITVMYFYLFKGMADALDIDSSEDERDDGLLPM